MQKRVIVIGGSTDGILAGAGLFRLDPESKIIVTRAHTLDLILQMLPDCPVVTFVNIAPNTYSSYTIVDFLREIKKRNGKVESVVDEHNQQLWAQVIKEAGLSYGDLRVKPVSQSVSDIGSSGALLLREYAREVAADSYLRELWEAADLADEGVFEGFFASTANKILKGSMHPVRRAYLVKWFAFNKRSNPTIDGWLKDYAPIADATEDALAATRGDGPVAVLDMPERQIDMSVYSKRLLGLGKKILVYKVRRRAGDSFTARVLPGIGMNVRKILEYAGIMFTGGSKAKCFIKDYQVDPFVEAAERFCK